MYLQILKSSSSEDTKFIFHAAAFLTCQQFPSATVVVFALLTLNDQFALAVKELG